MRTLMIAAFLTLTAGAFAQEAPSVPTEFSVSGLTTLIGQKIQEAKGATVSDFRGKVGAGLYLPIWTFHDQSGTDYIEFPNVGYRAIQGSRPSAFISMSFNLTGISGRLWNFDWARSHVRRSPFPPVFFGPTFIAPLDGTLSKLSIPGWKSWTGVVLSIRLK